MTLIKISAGLSIVWTINTTTLVGLGVLVLSNICPSLKEIVFNPKDLILLTLMTFGLFFVGFSIKLKNTDNILY